MLAPIYTNDGLHLLGNAYVEWPDFQILFYPVISMEAGKTHAVSREKLLGKNAGEEFVRLFSNELQVSVETAM